MRLTRITAGLAALTLSAACISISAQVPPQRPAATPEIVPKTDSHDVDALEREMRRRQFNPVLRVARDYTLPADGTVPEVLVVFGDTLIQGTVESDVIVVMGSAWISRTAVIEGSLGVFGGSATIEDGARVGQDLVVAGGTLNAPASFSPGSYQVLIGSPWLARFLKDITPWFTSGLMWGRLIVPGIEWVIVAVAVFFLLYLALNTVFDRATGACANALMDRPITTFFAGMLALLLVIPLLALLAVTVIGLILVPFVLCGAVVAWLIGKAAICRAVGMTLIGGDGYGSRVKVTIAFLIGFGLLTLAYMVPILGLVTWVLTGIMGFGAATMTLRSKWRRERPAAKPAADAVPPVPPMPAPAVPAATPVTAAIAPEPVVAAPTPAPPPLPPPAPRPTFASGLAAYPRGTFLDRLAAFLIDCVLVAVAMQLLEFDRLFFGGLDAGGFFFLLFAYRMAFWAWRGTTLGGVVCNLRVVRTDGASMSGADALLRTLGSMLSFGAAGIGFLWMLRDPENQTWHDKIAGTLVVKVPRELAWV